MNLTSEDKLLKIIESPRAAKKKSFFSFGGNTGLTQRVQILDPLFWRKENLVKLLNLRVLNKALVVGTVILTVFFIIDFLYQGTTLSGRFEDILTAGSKTKIPTKKGPELKVSLQESLHEARKRNIFSFAPPEEVIPEEGEGYYEEGGPGDSSVLEDYQLVGVIWSARNPQVIIEDSAARTHLLGVGDAIDELTVKEIQKDQVILSKDNNEWVLR
ncbi:MAG: hypothetical protein KAJ18_11345 [Candidatus Omnitrophica bacterium]|nr:hypothetical protein [Candidatus Omnitrophota bacterium]